MVKLLKINKDNFDSCIQLKVTNEQSKYISDNVLSLAQAYAYGDFARPFLIYDDVLPVGFIMLAVDSNHNEYHIWRIMIDKHYQRKGYGKQALLLAIKYLKNEGASVIEISHEVGNLLPGKLYCKLGFEYTGIVEDGEVMMELKV